TQHVLPGRRLNRSSASNYDSHNDGSQRLTETAVNFLANCHINTIISFNQYPYIHNEIVLLAKANVTYHHFSLQDHQSPTIYQAIDFHRFMPNASTPVHCGYSYGRTGTGITALQLFATWGVQPVETHWMSINHVEERSQILVLRQLHDRYRGKGDRGQYGDSDYKDEL
ncbi:uncharacterized protein BT62DRAFT_895233, partial [Guyanagaster necrorhizus]